MAKEGSDFQELLSQFGIDRKSIRKLRFGGVVGKLAMISMTGLLVIGVIAVKAAGPYLLWGCLGSVVLLSLISVGLVARHAGKHPVEATLEGGEIVAMEHLRHEYAAKGAPVIVPSAPIMEGIGQKPQLESKES